MLENPPLLTIHRGFRRPDTALIDQFRGAQTSHLADAMDGRGALDYRIKPLDPSNAVFAGPALTAFAYPADVAAVFGALSEASRATSSSLPTTASPAPRCWATSPRG